MIGSLIVLALTCITAMKVFTKYGVEGWKGLVPFYNTYVESGKVWNTNMGIAYIVLGLVVGIFSNITNPSTIMLVIMVVAALAYVYLNFRYSCNKAKAFGGSTALAALIFFLPFVANLYIGFAETVKYQGNRS